MAFRHVADSRGYSYTQMAEVGGNIGGDYRLFFKSAPFAYQGKQIRINHTVYLAAPLTFRIDVEVPKARAVHAHEPLAVSVERVATPNRSARQ